MTSGDVFNGFKEELKMALKKSKIKVGEDENGNIYETVTKDEVIERILRIYDYTVYQFIQINTSSIALEKILHKYAPDLKEEDYFQDYIRLVEEERLKNTYVFEEDEELRREEKASHTGFKVIKGGKTD